MQKLDGDVIGLNGAYIDILERITNKLDLLATLADEVGKTFSATREAYVFQRLFWSMFFMHE